MKKNIINEINDMKYLFTYKRGRILSEQEKYESEKINIEETEVGDLDDEDKDFNYLKGKMDEKFDLDMDDYSDEVPSFDSERMFQGMTKTNGDMELDEEMDFPTMSPGTKEKERIKIDPSTKPKQPKTPYKPKPGPKPDPKAGRKGDMPDWLTFDKLGIDFE
jgi:hypothetical protein